MSNINKDPSTRSNVPTHDQTPSDSGVVITDSDVYGSTGDDAYLVLTADEISVYSANGDDAIATLSFENLNLKGGNGYDFIAGSFGNDTINGGNSDDTLFGANGNDLIYGGNGNDHLDAGKGSDNLYGGNGFDTFHFAYWARSSGVSGLLSDGNDTIQDFNTLEDKLVLEDTHGSPDVNHIQLVDSGDDLVVSFTNSSDTQVASVTLIGVQFGGSVDDAISAGWLTIDGYTPPI